MSKKHGQRKKRRRRNPAVPVPRKALLAALAELGVSEKDWRRVQKARRVCHEVSDAIAARGGAARYCVMQVTAHDRPEMPAFLSVDEK